MSTISYIGPGHSLWCVAFNVSEERYRPVCYLCDWRGKADDDPDHAQLLLDGHTSSVGHLDRVGRR